VCDSIFNFSSKSHAVSSKKNVHEIPQRGFLLLSTPYQLAARAAMGEGEQQPDTRPVSTASASSNSSAMGEGEQQPVTRAVDTVSASSNNSVLGEGEQESVSRAVSTVSASSSSSAHQQYIKWQKTREGKA